MRNKTQAIYKAQKKAKKKNTTQVRGYQQINQMSKELVMKTIFFPRKKKVKG